MEAQRDYEHHIVTELNADKVYYRKVHLYQPWFEPCRKAAIP